MLTKRHSIGFIAGLVALAFVALPAAASAAELTDANGPVEVGSTITATSENVETTLEGGGLLACEHVEVFGIVEVNSGETVQVGDDVQGNATNCFLNGHLTTILPTLEELHLEGMEGRITFSFEIFVSPPPIFVREHTTSIVTWVTGTRRVHFEGPVTGAVPGTIHGEFTITDEAGEVVVD